MQAGSEKFHVKKIVQKIVKIPVGLPVAPGISENLFHILNTICLVYIFVCFLFLQISTVPTFLYRFQICLPTRSKPNRFF